MHDHITPRERLDALHTAYLVMSSIPTHPGRRTYLQARSYLMQRRVWRAEADCQHVYTDSSGSVRRVEA